jgi:hypothetical protein
MRRAKPKENKCSLNLGEPCESHTEIESTKEDERRKAKRALFDITREYIGTVIAEWKQERTGGYQFLAASSPMHNNARHQSLYLL